MDEGTQVELEAAAAVRWYRAASELGDAESQDMLSWLLVEAELLPPDYEEARRWALAAAEQGVASAMTRLGMLYHTLGRREQSRHELSAAITLYRAMDMLFWLPQAEAALAEAEG